MPNIELVEQIIVCPNCNATNSYSLLEILQNERVNCSRWRCPSIKVLNYYRREDIAERLGRGDFAGVNDSFDATEEREAMLQGAEEERLEMGLV